MTRIRVDPANLRQAARQLNGIADRLRALGSEAHQVTLIAPSYEGQFGPKARAMGMEAEARLRAQADRFTSLSEELEARAAAFEAVDQETLTAFERLTQLLQGWIEQAKPILTPYTQIALFPWQKVERYLRLGYLIEEPGDENGEGEEEDEWSPPWWSPIVMGASGFWNWYDLNVNQRIYSILDQSRTGGQNLINLIGITQYQALQAQNAPADYMREYIFLVQEPGLPADGPITLALLKMSATDTYGNPISPVGAELSDLISGREIKVTFIGSGGAAPWTGRIVVGEKFITPSEMETPFGTALVAHELKHLLQRDLDDPYYFPSGEPTLSQPRSRVVGDSTNYMEVLAYIVGETVEYDLLSQIPEASRTAIEANRITQIQNHLATLTDSDALNATRYIVKEYNYVNVYKQNYVTEVSLSDHRIPPGCWDYWLKEVGFSDNAINHIQSIAALGTSEHIDPNLIDPKTGIYSTVTPTVTPTASPIPTPSPSATSTPTVSPTTTPTQTDTPTSTPTPSNTPTPEH